MTHIDWQPIATAPRDGTNFLAACVCIADEYGEDNNIVRRAVRERYVRVAQFGFGFHTIPWNGGILTNEFFTHWAPLPALPPDTN